MQWIIRISGRERKDVWDVMRDKWPYRMRAPVWGALCSSLGFWTHQDHPQITSYLEDGKSWIFLENALLQGVLSSAPFLLFGNSLLASRKHRPLTSHSQTHRLMIRQHSRTLQCRVVLAEGTHTPEVYNKSEDRATVLPFYHSPPICEKIILFHTVKLVMKHHFMKAQYKGGKFWIQGLLK